MFKFKDAFKLSAAPVFIASLCCISPIIIVLAGLGSVTLASSLADTLYGDYKWYFRAVGLVLLIGATVLYLRRSKGICTIDDAVRRKNEIINIVGLSLAAGVVGYIVFLYVIVHYIGAFMGLWPY